MKHIPISFHPAHISVHSSFSPSQLSLVLATPSLLSAAGLFRLGRDKWERLNILGAWESRRGECEGWEEGRGGGGGNLNSLWRLDRKIKPAPWWRLMNGRHYEGFAEWSDWKKKKRKTLWRWGSGGMKEDELVMIMVPQEQETVRKIHLGKWKNPVFSLLQMGCLSMKVTEPKVLLSKLLSSLCLEMVA